MAAATRATAHSVSDFDAGPLSWVQGEIDHALARGLDALALFVAHSHDHTYLRQARMHVHQAAGALQIVGVDGVISFTDEIERQLAHLEDVGEQEVAAASEHVDRACRKLQMFLRDVVNGTSPVPLKLFPEYEAMQRARGVRAAAPADLFHPELDRQAPRRRQVSTVAKPHSYLVRQRRQYQSGLLEWLRGEENGARQMRDAIAAIEESTEPGSLRTFWWSTCALHDSLIEGGLDASLGVKQLAARIDLQIRKLVEGSPKVADRLRREVLYYVAISAPVARSVAEVQETFQLSGLIPSPEVLHEDIVRIQPHVRDAREQLSHAKDAWLKLTSGRAENLPQLRETLATVHRHAAEVNNGALVQLIGGLASRLDQIAAGHVPEPVAMEFATALLLAENAFENPGGLPPQFIGDVDTVLSRLDAARESRTIESAAPAPVVDEMSRRAQERLLLAQVGREIQTNLRHMEQVLDAFFRDHAKRGELQSLARDSDQIRGALLILGLDSAAELLGLCQQQIDAYAEPAAPVNDEDLELLAESLSGLGFYVEAVEQQRADHERLIAPLLAKRRGEAPAAAEPSESSIEAAVASTQAELPELVAAWEAAGAGSAAQATLEARLTELGDDAKLIGDDELASHARAALRELGAGAPGPVLNAIIGADGPPAAPLSDETQRILASDDSAIDNEILDVFITEAREVLKRIGEQYRSLALNPGDREALRIVRRQFHTLKGSGRMVGLTDLGDIAYALEKMHNRLLEEDRPVTQAVLAMIATGESEFRRWMSQLANRRRTQPDPACVQAAIAAVEEELPHPRPMSEGAPSPVAVSPFVPVAMQATSATEPVPGGPVALPSTALVEPGAHDDEQAAPPEPVEFPAEVSPDVAEAEQALNEAIERELMPVDDSDSTLAPEHDGELLDSVAVDEVAAQFEAALADDAGTAADLPELGVPAGAAPEIWELFAVEPEARASNDDLDSLADLLDELDASPTAADASSTAPPGIESPEVAAPHEVALAVDGQTLDPEAIEYEIAAPEPMLSDTTVVPLHREPSADEHPAPDAHPAAEDVASGTPEHQVAPPDGARSATRDAVVIEWPMAPRPREVVHPAVSAPAGTPGYPEIPPGADQPVPAHEQAAASHAEAASDTMYAEGGDDIAIGDVSLSRTLYEVLIAEADGHVDVLAHELAVLQFDPGYLPGDAMVRASHTLCGIHRTAGFPVIAVTAKALEDCLATLRDAAFPLSSASLPILSRAINGLAGLIGTLKARQPSDPVDVQEAQVIQRELDALRQQTELRVQMHAYPGAHATASGMHAVGARPLDVAQPAVPAAPVLPAESIVIAADAAATHVPIPHDASTRATHTAPAAPAHDDATALEQMRDDVDEQLLPIFLEEAEELFPQAGEQLRAWRRNPDDASHALALRRLLHTFKGSARMAGAMRLGELTHRMESRLLDGDAVRLGSGELFEALDADLDRVAFVLDALREGRTDVALPWEDEPTVAPAGTTAVAVESVDELGRAPSSVVVAMPGAAAPSAAAPDNAGPAGPEADTAQRAVLRVRADIVDRLVNEAGEVAIARARIEGELRALKGSLLELTTSVIRMRSQVREIEIQAESQIQSRLSMRQDSNTEFDPLEFDRFTRFQELTRSLAEGVNDVSTVQQSLLRNIDEADAALIAQARLSRDMQQQLLSIRTVPFGSLAERLYRILRQVAKELDKRVNLDVQGAQVELDRSVLEKLAGPLEHLLRNALDHGIESRESREGAGKSATGQVVVAARQVGNEIAIELTDDGAGLDLERIRQRAVAQGRLDPDATPTQAQLVDCIFESGFSTASKVTAVSGRGIGMDVVRTDIAALGGRVEVTTRPGQGTTFTLYLPLTLAVAQAVLVRAGERLWALPAPMVEQVQQVKSEPLLGFYAAHALDFQGRTYPLHYLPRLLGDTQHVPPTGRFNPVLLLRTAQGTAAIHVDEMVGNQEVVVKNVGPQLARVSGIAGATVLGSGEVVLIINPVQLAQRANLTTFDPQAEARVAQAARATPETAGPPVVMVVDDSLTVRKITSRLLAREGFEVLTAKDGLDALQVLAQRVPDVMLLDIEMPRMDGFELTKTLKSDPRLAHIPIVMITSRTAEKHQNRARELGVDLYLGKPYQEDELLRHLREMLAVAA